MGNAAHGVVYAFTLETAVAQDLPGLHAGEGVLDAGADLLVGLVVYLLPVREFLSLSAPVGHHEAGARVAAVRDRHGVADGGLGPGFHPCLAVSAVARKRPTDHDDQLARRRR